MSRTPALAVVGVLVASLIALTGCSAGSRSDGGNSGFVGGTPELTQVPPDRRQPAPDIRGTSLDGKPVALSDYRGKVVVINVWGSWCPPCRAETGDLVAAAQATRQTAAFLGINTLDTGTAQGQAFQRAYDVTYPSIYDPTGEQLVKFAGVLPPQAIPSTLVIDAQGRMAARVLTQVSKTTLIGLVDDVAAGK